MYAKAKGLTPGTGCDKTNCAMFPCVVIGKDHETAVRRLFDADPEVVAWRAEGA